MRILIDAINVTHMPWPEHLVLSSKGALDVDPQDGTMFLSSPNLNSYSSSRSPARNRFVSSHPHLA